VGTPPVPTSVHADYDAICELTLETEDFGAMEWFYCAGLGMRVLSREPDRLWLACGSRTRLGLWSPGKKEYGDEGGRHVHFALSVTPDRLDALRAHLQDLAIAHRGPVRHDGGDRSLYIPDPEGNVVEVWDFFRRAPVGVDALA
jgi:catechol-2,3-dioxygenase